MSKISREHLSRQAVVYVRQSTFDQVQNNLESQRRQDALAERAKSLGWQDVIVTDDDLSRSGGGAHRPTVSWRCCAREPLARCSASKHRALHVMVETGTHC